MIRVRRVGAMRVQEGVTRLLAFALLLGAGPQDELPAVLDRLQAPRDELRDVRASWTFRQSGEFRKGEPDGLRPRSSGTLLLRGSDEAAWTARPERGNFVRMSSVTGLRGVLRPDALVVHGPWSMRPPGHATERHPHHGAEWFTGNPAKDSPALFPMLALQPEDFPAFAFLDLAPRRFLSMLPGLFVLGRFKEGEKDYLVLKAQPGARTSLRDEDQRAWGRTWTEVKLWIDPAAGRLARVALRSDCDASGPTEHEWICDYGRRDGDGVAVEMSIRHVVAGRPRLGSTWRFDLVDLKINGGVAAEETALAVPAGRIPRDWVLQPEAVYEARLAADPKDASAWLNLGSLRLQRYEGDFAEPFRKAIGLRPDAVEGYAGLLFALGPKEADPVPFLQEALRAGVRSPAVPLALAYRTRERAHFDLALKLGGEDAEVLVDAARWAGRDPADKRALYVRALRAEGAEESHAYGEWKALQPPPEELLAMYRLLEPRAESCVRNRARLADLALSLDRRDEAMRHAAAAVETLGRDIRPDDDYAVGRILQAFLDARDFDAAGRLHATVAGWTDEKWRSRADSIECRIHVLRDSTEELLRFHDERVPSVPPKSLAFAVREQKRADAVIEALLATPAEHPKRAARGAFLEILADENLRGARQKDVAIRAGEMRRGAAGRPEELLQLARTLVHEQRWKEARAKAGELLARAETSQHRFDAERVIAEAFLGEGDLAAAVAAAGRALDEKGASYREYGWLLRGRALLAHGEPAKAAEAYAAGFDDPESKFPFVLFRQIPPQVSHWKPLRERAEAGPHGAGMLAVLALARSAAGDAAGAAEAIERAAALRPGDAVFVRERLRLRAAALKVREAMADRALLPDGTDVRKVNEELVDAAERLNDAAVMKDLARTLAAEYWTPRRADTRSLSEILQAIREEAFFGEIEELLLSKTDKDYGPILATQLLVWAWSPMGWHEKAIARCKGVLADPARAKHHDMMRSWIGSLEDLRARHADPLEEIVRRAEAAGDPDPVRALERAVAGLRGRDEGRLADRICRAALRQGKGEAIHAQVLALRSGDPAEQARLLEALVERDPKAAEWRIRLALVHLGSGNADAAVKSLVEAARTVPGSHPSWGSLEEKLGGLTPAQAKALGPVLEEKGAYRAAWEISRAYLDTREDRLRFAERWRAAAKGGDLAAALFAQAVALMELERPDEALDALSEIERRQLAHSPLLREAERRRVLLEAEERKRLNGIAQRGDGKELARAIHRVVRRPGSGPGAVDRSLYLLAARGGKLLEFVMAWEEATAAEPPSAGASLFLARIHEMAGQWSEVRRVLEEGRKALPGETAFELPLAEARMRLEDFRGAAEILEAALAREADPDSAVGLRMTLARCYGLARRPADALAQIRALDRKGLRGTLAGLAAEAKLPEEAARLFRAALEEEPAGAGSHRLGLARALRDSGKLREAEAEYRRTIREHSRLAASAAPELFEILPEEGRPSAIASAMIEALRATEDGRARRSLLYSLALTVPEKDRGKVLEAWDARSGGNVAERAAGAALLISWGGTPARALERLRALDAEAPGSVWVYLEFERVLRHSEDPAEQARVQERLADLDPKGEAGGIPAAARRAAALRHHVDLKRHDDVLRLGLRVLGDPERREHDARAAREALATATARLDEKGWLKLKSLALPAPVPELAARAKAIVLRLSDDEFERRRAARRELHAMGVPALPFLLPLVDSDDLDLRGQARGAVEDILTR